MKKEKPLFGSVSLNRGQWTVNYETDGICEDIRKIGYSKNVFDGCPDNMPIIRFDLADEVNIWNFLCKNLLPRKMYINKLPRKMYINKSSTYCNYVSTEDFLDAAEEHGIPVINLCDCNFGSEGNS
jgi:hypothetical protein